MTSTPTNNRPSAPTRGAHTTNPVQIGLIGTDHIQLSIRPAPDDAELLVLVDRVEQLIDAGYDSFEVVLEERDAPDDPWTERPIT